MTDRKATRTCCGGFGSMFGGLSLITIGGYFLARELGWIDYDFPFWAVFLIIAGLWLVVSAVTKR